MEKHIKYLKYLHCFFFFQTYYYKQPDKCILQATSQKETSNFYWFLVCDKFVDMQ